MDRMKVYQYYYNIVMYRVELYLMMVKKILNINVYQKVQELILKGGVLFKSSLLVVLILMKKV
jgi:hypothetical protein